MNTGDNPTRPAIGRSFPTTTPLSYPLLFGQGAITDDIMWGFLAGRIGLRHLFTPQTGELCLSSDGCNSSGSAALFAHCLSPCFLSLDDEAFHGNCRTLGTHRLDFCHSRLNIPVRT